jgi:hypothetical protein
MVETRTSIHPTLGLSKYKGERWESCALLQVNLETKLQKQTQRSVGSCTESGLTAELVYGIHGPVGICGKLQPGIVKGEWLGTSRL